MLIFIICLVVGVLLCGLAVFFNYKDPFEDLVAVLAALGVFFLIATATMGGFMIAAKAQNRYNFEVLEAEYESLNLRLEKAQNATDKDALVELNGLYEDIYNYNMKIKERKYWGNNIWTNWFYSQKTVKEGKYIELTPQS